MSMRLSLSSLIARYFLKAHKVLFLSTRLYSIAQGCILRLKAVLGSLRHDYPPYVPPSSGHTARLSTLQKPNFPAQDQTPPCQKGRTAQALIRSTNSPAKSRGRDRPHSHNESMLANDDSASQKWRKAAKKSIDRREWPQ